MPNTTAYLVLAAWPCVALVLFRRLPVERALIWTLLGGYLVLPPLANFDLPLLPPLNKVLIPNLMALALCVFVLRDRLPPLPRSRLARLLIAMFVLGSIPTVLSNGDVILFRTGGLPGLRVQDVLSAAGTQAILLLPYLLARRYLCDEPAMRDLLLALVLGAVAYSVPALVEVGVGPMLNIWVYGFFQHDFEQMLRYGGYRPIVFLPHGIWLAFFVMTAVLGAASLLRYGTPDTRPRALFALVWLAVVLVLCKTFGAIGYALFGLPLVLFASPALRVRIALVLAVIAVVYPLLRGGGLVPVEAILAQAEALDAERAASLRFRFENEEALLAHANERPVFGWGGWGRNLMYDPDTAELLTIPDGRWIIVFGVYGWLGFLAEFGLLALPLWLLWRGARAGAAVGPHAATVALILALNMFDLLPNATLEPLTWLVAGAVLGHAERIRAPASAAAAAPVTRQRRTVI